jgi:MtN3 and saliva related transmembrane protein
MSWISVLGFCAAVCTTVSFLPQAIKAIKTRRTKDISLIMYCVFITGLVLWLTYGILIWDLPIILANFITLILAGIILVMKLRCG